MQLFPCFFGTKLTLRSKIISLFNIITSGLLFKANHTLKTHSFLSIVYTSYFCTLCLAHFLPSTLNLLHTNLIFSTSIVYIFHFSTFLDFLNQYSLKKKKKFHQFANFFCGICKTISNYIYFFKIDNFH